MSLQEACDIIGIPYIPDAAEESKIELLQAAEIRQKCKSCRLPAPKTTDCTVIDAVIDNGRYAFRYGICRKGRAYLRQKHIDQLVRSSGMGQLFRQRRFETFEHRPGTEEAYRACQAFCKTFTQQSRGVRLIGTTGCGKTHLAAAVVNAMLQRGVPSMLLVVPDLMRQIRRGFDSKDQAAIANDIMDAAKSINLLVLDDLGAEKAGDWTREQLFIIINARYEQQLPTIITTNCGTGDMIQRLQQRIVSRLVEMTTSVTITASDYRLERGATG